MAESRKAAEKALEVFVRNRRLSDTVSDKRRALLGKGRDAQISQVENNVRFFQPSILQILVHHIVTKWILVLV